QRRCVYGPKRQPELLSVPSQEQEGVQEPQRIAEPVPPEMHAEDRPNDGIDVMDEGAAHAWMIRKKTTSGVGLCNVRCINRPPRSCHFTAPSTLETPRCLWSWASSRAPAPSL